MFELRDLEVQYSGAHRGARRRPRHRRPRDHRVHRAVGLRQDHGAALPQPDARPHPGRQGHRPGQLPRREISTARRSTRPRCAAGSAWCSRSRTRSRSRSSTTSRTARRINGRKRVEMDDIVEQALHARRAVGRGQGQAQEERPVAVGWSAAAALHRARARGRARRHAHGRAVLRARPDRHRAHRGPDGRAQARLHDRDRHPQHAAGRARRPTAPAFFTAEVDDAGRASVGSSSSTSPRRSSPRPTDARTEGYITGRFG